MTEQQPAPLGREQEAAIRGRGGRLVELLMDKDIEIDRLRAALAEAERGNIDALIHRLDALAWPYILITAGKQGLEYEVEIELSGRPNGTVVSRKADTLAEALSAVMTRLEECGIFQPPERSA